MTISVLKSLEKTREDMPGDISLEHVAGPDNGMPVLIATMHGKEAILGPMLAKLGFKVLLPVGYDTDALGTFSGDIRRHGTAFDAVLEKARRACQITCVPRAVASEGSYRPSQELFPGARNVELLAFVDLQADYACIEHLTNTATSFVKGRVRPDLDAPETISLLREMQWPRIKALVVPEDPILGTWPEDVFKGIGDRATLKQALESCAAKTKDGLVHVETDLRAHMNPTRMESIASVAKLLAARLYSSNYGEQLRSAA
ncbi:MAG: hypothetical protein GAK35_02963 [Herbaspirillum frisingense]|uniref:DUF6671 domain-containing protein n=1 Tax=Herbaspirillum frisingense TaxID=92645 RepID=A0A7V8JTJ6_9BURK|nr:MAG: hypothetical protein GAK35_02963 [Herbaspirillum frisingense]